MEIKNVYVHERRHGSVQPVEAEGIVLEPIAVNKSGKMIGARIVGVDPELYVGSGSICLLPKPTECDTHEAIETLIDVATSEERSELEWRGRLDIPGLSEIEKDIGQLKLNYDKQKNALETKRQSLDKYRDIFSVHEAPQIDAVRLALKDMGLETERTKPGFPVDLLGSDLAIEVTSIAGKINSDSPKMFQLLQFSEKHRKNEKVVLIANTFKREYPSDRIGKQDFTPQVIEFLKSNKVCAMTCVTLLKLWKLAKNDQAKAKNLILQTDGELSL